MRAVIGSRHGGPEVLQIGEVAPPEPVPGQVLVDVAAQVGVMQESWL